MLDTTIKMQLAISVLVERSPGEGETQVQFLKSVLDAEKPDWHFIQQRKKNRTHVRGCRVLVDEGATCSKRQAI